MQTKEEKRQEVELLREKLSRANTVLLADYRGLTVAESNELRASFREIGEGGIEYRVAKNTLLKIALEGTGAEGLATLMSGPTALCPTSACGYRWSTASRALVTG